MKAEDTKLQGFITKARLDSWWVTTRSCAEETVGTAYSRLTEKERKRNSMFKGEGAGLGELSVMGNGSAVKKATFERLDPSGRVSLFST